MLIAITFPESKARNNRRLWVRRTVFEKSSRLQSPVNLLPLRPAPGRIHLVSVKDVLIGRRFPHFHTVLLGKTNIPAPVFAELLEEGAGAASEIEHDGTEQFSTPEPVCGEEQRQFKRRPGVDAHQFRVGEMR
jgi:hypothetical protein